MVVDIILKSASVAFLIQDVLRELGLANLAYASHPWQLFVEGNIATANVFQTLF